MTELRTIAFIGLGKMGLPMVTRLVAAGYSVRGFDVSPDAVKALAAVGATGRPDAASAVRDADAVILMLPNSTIVNSVVHGLIDGSELKPGTPLIDMGSSNPMSTKDLATTVQAAGARLLDAPVSGGVKGALNGTLTIMVGGTGDDVEMCAPIFRHLGKIVRTGAVGSGHAMKALNNLLSATHLWVTSEAMRTGQQFGLDPDVMLAVFNNSSGKSGSTENKWPNFIRPGTFNSGFSLGLMLKDMRIATALAESTGTTNRLATAAVELWSEAAADLGPTADHTEIARWIDQQAVAQ